MTGDADSLGAVLDRLERVAGETDPVTVDAVLDELGRRSFGVALLVPGLVILAPLVGDIPGVPTMVAAVVLLSVGQLLLGRESPWLPRWLLERDAEAETVRKVVDGMRPAVRLVDRVVEPRLTALTGKVGRRVIAVVSVVVAAGVPLMEVIPFSANVAGVLLSGFGLALISSDGLLALVTVAVAGAISAVVVLGVL